MMTINAPSPFSKSQQLRIDIAREGYFILQGLTSNGTTIDVDTLISSLFFTYEANVYGLLTNRADFTIEVSTAELLDIFSSSYQHPFISWVGANEESKEWLEKVWALQKYWQEPSLWSHAVLAEDFSSLAFPINDIDSALLETGVQQKLSQVGLIFSDLPKLLPFFLRGGWPLDQTRQVGTITVSLRLSEPEEDSDVWLLETVLSTATTKNYWTPAIRKQSLPIEDALPTKWRMFAIKVRTRSHLAGVSWEKALPYGRISFQNS